MKKRSFNNIYQLFVYTAALMTLFAPPSTAQKTNTETPYTKESYMRDCQKNRKDDVSAYCACHFNLTMNSKSAATIKNAQTDIEKAEKQRRNIFEKLRGYPGVTEANLKRVCNDTNAVYWDYLATARGIHKSQMPPKGQSRTNPLSQSIVAGKIKADKIFQAYKEAHGMYSTKNGHGFDNSGKWLSTNEYMSYCVPLNKLSTLQANTNDPKRIHRYDAQSINSSADKKKCFDLIPQAAPRINRSSSSVGGNQTLSTTSSISEQLGLKNLDYKNSIDSGYNKCVHNSKTNAQGFTASQCMCAAKVVIGKINERIFRLRLQGTFLVLPPECKDT